MPQTLEQVRISNAAAQRAKRERERAGKKRFVLELDENLVADALYEVGRDRGLDLGDHAVCSRLLAEWNVDLLAAVMRDSRDPVTQAYKSDNESESNK